MNSIEVVNVQQGATGALYCHLAWLLSFFFVGLLGGARRMEAAEAAAQVYSVCNAWGGELSFLAEEATSSSTPRRGDAAAAACGGVAAADLQRCSEDYSHHNQSRKPRRPSNSS